MSNHIAPNRARTSGAVTVWMSALILMLLLGGCAEDATTSLGANAIVGTPKATQTPRPTATPRPTPTATPFVLATVFHDSGNGDKLTTDFVVNEYWALTWKCDHSSDYGLDYNVIIELIDPLTGSSDGTIVNALCENGDTGSTVFTTNPTPGDFELQVISEGYWAITVQEDQPG